MENNMNNISKNELLIQNRNFLFMAGYRWVSLIPVLLTPPPAESTLISGITILIIAFSSNILISIFHKPLNKSVNKFPVLMSIDLIFMAGIITLSGGTSSPYFLFALSPLLASALFFKVKGAVLNASIFTPLFIIAEIFYKNQILEEILINDILSKLVHIWLMTLLFAYSSVLLKQLLDTHQDLEQASQDASLTHRQLKIVHEITLHIQNATDIQSVQTKVLKAVKEELGYSSAVVGLVDPVSEMLGNWASFPKIPQPDEGFAALPLNFEYGPLLEKLAKKETFYISPSESPTSNVYINQWLGDKNWISLPMILQDHPVGVLMIELQEQTDKISIEEENVLKLVANQAAVGLGTTLMCIDRARNLAIEQERNRFAREIHDTVAQSLFGMNYSLEGIIGMLGEDLPKVREELIEVQKMATQSREEIRHSIFNMWPSQLSLESFVSDLTLYAKQFCRPRDFEVVFDTIGDFDNVPQGIRRSLYRITQEAVTNITQHSGVSSAEIEVKILEDEIHLQIKDEGQGFDPDLVMNRAYNRESFGLHGIKERVEAINGAFKIESHMGKGTRLEVNIPLNPI